MILGIDAHNIRAGGGLNYLIEILNHFDEKDSKFTKIVIWALPHVLEKIENKNIFEKKNHWLLSQNINAYKDLGQFKRFVWHYFFQSKTFKQSKCDLVFIPGPYQLSGFNKYIIINQNYLPFDDKELKKIWPSIRYFKMKILKYLQIFSFKNSSGIIFLSEFTFNSLSKYININLLNKTKIIPLGVNNQFCFKQRILKKNSEFNKKNPFKLVYVSTIDTYKNHINVFEATKQLVDKGYNIHISFIGPSYNSSLKKLINKMSLLDRKNIFSEYIGEVSYENLLKYYREADLKIFASSCEAMPSILIEAMASGLPLACSNIGPMPEMAKDAAIYFNPNEVESIKEVIEKIFLNYQLREKLSTNSLNLSKKYSWKICSKETFNFFENVIKN